MVIVDVKGTEIQDLYEINHVLLEGKRLKISTFDGPTEKVILDITMEVNEVLNVRMRASIQQLELP